MPSIIVTAPARLHLGFIDPEGSLGRRFGGLGVAISEPRLVVEARTAPTVHVEGDPHGRVEPLLHDLVQHFGVDQGISIRCRELIPAHVGLGSGTQLSLAVAAAAARLFKRNVPLADLARLTKRGRRSGVGVHVFAHGGFILDGGTGNAGGMPPVVFQHPFPPEWRFVVVVPESDEALHGPAEEEAFRRLATPPHHEVGTVCRLILLQLLPSLIEKDIEGFGQALTGIQRIIGGWFAPIQGGTYAAPLAAEILELMASEGVVGVGQSSWGPTLYGVVGGPDRARHLETALRRALDGRVKAMIFSTGANNRGAIIESGDSRGTHRSPA